MASGATRRDDGPSAVVRKRFRRIQNCKDHILFYEYCADEKGRGMGVLYQAVRVDWPPRCSRSCMSRSTRSVAGERLNIIAASVSLIAVRVAQGGSVCLNQNGLKS